MIQLYVLDGVNYGVSGFEIPRFPSYSGLDVCISSQ